AEQLLAGPYIPGPVVPALQRQLERVGQIDLEDVFHLGREARIVDLDIDLVVAGQAQPVEVGRADGRPLPVDRGGIGVDHGVLKPEDAYALAQACSEVAARQPVGGGVVGLPGQQHTHVDATLRRLDQRREDHAVGDEVRVGQVDVVLGAVDRLQVHAANRQHQ